MGKKWVLKYHAELTDGLWHLGLGERYDVVECGVQYLNKRRVNRDRTWNFLLLASRTSRPKLLLVRRDFYCSKYRWHKFQTEVPNWVSNSWCLRLCPQLAGFVTLFSRNSPLVVENEDRTQCDFSLTLTIPPRPGCAIPAQVAGYPPWSKQTKTTTSTTTTMNIPGILHKCAPLFGQGLKAR